MYDRAVKLNQGYLIRVFPNILGKGGSSQIVFQKEILNAKAFGIFALKLKSAGYKKIN